MGKADNPSAPGRHSPHSPSDSSSVSFYLPENPSPDALYLRAVPKQHYFRQPRSSSSSSHLRRADTSTTAGSPSVSSGGPSSRSARTPGRRDCSPTTSTATTLRTEKTQSPSIASSESTNRVAVTAQPPPLPHIAASLVSPPLGPHWGDYSFREADLYYGQAGQQEAVTSEDAAITLESGNQPPKIRAVLCGARDQLLSRKARPVQKGFEVRRPPRPSNA